MSFHDDEIELNSDVERVKNNIDSLATDVNWPGTDFDINSQDLFSGGSQEFFSGGNSQDLSWGERNQENGMMRRNAFVSEDGGYDISDVLGGHGVITVSNEGLIDDPEINSQQMFMDPSVGIGGMDLAVGSNENLLRCLEDLPEIGNLSGSLLDQDYKFQVQGTLGLHPGRNSFDDNETICFEDFAGDFDFKVVPVEAAYRKLVFNQEHKKVFCQTGTHGFNIFFKNMHDPEMYKVRISLAFLDAEHKNKPVQKCLNCFETQKRMGVDVAVLPHVLRAEDQDTQVQYVLSSTTQRYYLIIPMRRPQPGSTSLTQSLNFSCMSSCKSDGGINRRPTAIIFTLLDPSDVVRGRSVLKLRICSAPQRDENLEFKDKREKNQTNRRGRKRTNEEMSEIKIEPKSIPETVDDEVTKQATVAEKPTADGTWILPHERVGEVTEGSNSQDQSSSQETAYSDDEDSTRPSLKLKKLFRETRHILKWRRSEVESKRICASNMYSCLRHAQEICHTGSTIRNNNDDQ